MAKRLGLTKDFVSSHQLGDPGSSIHPEWVPVSSTMFFSLLFSHLASKGRTLSCLNSCDGAIGTSLFFWERHVVPPSFNIEVVSL